TGEGTGGAAGFAKGGAEVQLEDAGSETVLRYTASAQVGGKLAQIGSRLIDSTAKKLANEFFGNFAREVGGAPAAPAEAAAPAGSAPVEAAPAAAPPPPAEPAKGGISPMVWVIGLIAVVAIGLLIFAAG